MKTLLSVFKVTLEGTLFSLVSILAVSTSQVHGDAIDIPVSVGLVSNCSSLPLCSEPQKLPCKLGALFSIKPGWHIYWQNSGESGLPTKVAWKLPPDWAVGKLQWPLPRKFREHGSIRTFGYSQEVLLFSELIYEGTKPLAIDSEVAFEARIEWLMCKDVCIPAKKDLKLLLTIKDASSISEQASVFEKYQRLVPFENIRSAQSKIAFAPVSSPLN